MSGSRVRFAILGFGHHAVRRLVPSFPMSERAELVGLWRRDAAAGARNAEEFGIRHSFRSREELCASPEVDAVFITSPDAMHRDDTLLALGHGKAVLCEKPLAMNAAEAAEMEAAAGRAGLLFGVAQNFRWNRSMEWIRERVDAGAIGEVQMAHAEFSYPAQTAPRKWITDPALATGGPIGDVGVHCLDALRFALRQDPVTVSTLARQDALSGAVEASGIDAVRDVGRGIRDGCDERAGELSDAGGDNGQRRGACGGERANGGSAGGGAATTGGRDGGAAYGFKCGWICADARRIYGGNGGWGSVSGQWSGWGDEHAGHRCGLQELAEWAAGAGVASA